MKLVSLLNLIPRDLLNYSTLVMWWAPAVDPKNNLCGGLFIRQEILVVRFL